MLVEFPACKNCLCSTCYWSLFDCPKGFRGSVCVECCGNPPKECDTYEEI